jgi:hypothetical protein
MAHLRTEKTVSTSSPASTIHQSAFKTNEKPFHSIYAIQPDSRHYKSFVLDRQRVRKALGHETEFHFARAPKRYLNSWQPFDINFENLSASIRVAMPDIMVRNGRLFLSIAAYDVLSPIIAEHGEFLPITYEGCNGFIFNVLSVVDDIFKIDKKISNKNEFSEVKSLYFYDNKINKMALFRTATDGYLDIYCGEALKNAIEKNQLKGIKFSGDTEKIYQ